MTKQGNYRVIVEVEEPWGKVTDEKWRSNCESLVKDIKRHADGFTYVFWKADTLCEFCENIWEVQPHDTDHIPKGQPLCCDEAVKEWEASQK